MEPHCVIQMYSLRYLPWLQKEMHLKKGKTGINMKRYVLA